MIFHTHSHLQNFYLSWAVSDPNLPYQPTVLVITLLTQMLNQQLPTKCGMLIGTSRICANRVFTIGQFYQLGRPLPNLP